MPKVELMLKLKLRAVGFACTRIPHVRCFCTLTHPPQDPHFHQSLCGLRTLLRFLMPTSIVSLPITLLFGVFAGGGVCVDGLWPFTSEWRPQSGRNLRI